MKPPFFALRAMALGLAAAYCLAPTACQAQTPDEDPPRLIKPVPTLDPAEKNRREALDQYLHGLIELGANRPVEAIGFLDKALELDPKALPPKRALVWAHHQLFRRDEVIRLGTEVLQRDPDDITLALTVAASLTIRGMETEAGDLLEKLLQAEKVQETLSLKIDVLGELANLRLRPIILLRLLQSQRREHPRLLSRRPNLPKLKKPLRRYRLRVQPRLWAGWTWKTIYPRALMIVWWCPA